MEKERPGVRFILTPSSRAAFSLMEVEQNIKDEVARARLDELRNYIVKRKSNSFSDFTQACMKIEIVWLRYRLAEIDNKKKNKYLTFLFDKYEESFPQLFEDNEDGIPYVIAIQNRVMKFPRTNWDYLERTGTKES